MSWTPVNVGETARRREEHAPGAGQAPGGHAACAPAFSHQALFYADAQDFLAGAVPFVRAGLEREEPVMVAVTEPRRFALHGELGPDAGLVRFVKMESLGANPARIIPAWRRFVDEHVSPTQPVRGIGEPIWPGRGPAELVECERHEALLNLAFADSPAWQLLCPYDTLELDDATLAGACCTHPLFAEPAGLRASEDYLNPYHALDPFAGELPEPDGAVCETRFSIDGLAVVRDLIASQAVAVGLDRSRSSDLVLAVDELAANSVCHGGGEGTLHVWREPDSLVCEVRDGGHISDPLAGRHEPEPRQACGRGLWIVNQVCDLVQVRSSADATVVRLHMRLN